MQSSKPKQALLSNTSQALSIALGVRDIHTLGHCERVVTLCRELAIHLDFSQRELGILEVAAQFHDIGKIGIPDNVLHKPSRFEPAEWECMKQHSVIGERIVRALACDHADEIALSVRHHHEHFDGSGYPDALSGTQIPIYSRIISLTDCYDAVAETRPYHQALKHREIMDLLHSENGIKHDPDLLHAFNVVIEKSAIRKPDND